MDPGSLVVSSPPTMEGTMMEDAIELLRTNRIAIDFGIDDDINPIKVHAIDGHATTFTTMPIVMYVLFNDFDTTRVRL